MTHVLAPDPGVQLLAAMDPATASIVVAVITGPLVILITGLLARQAKRASDDAAGAAAQMRAERNECREQLAWTRRYIESLAERNGMDLEPYPEDNGEGTADDHGTRRTRGRRRRS